MPDVVTSSRAVLRTLVEVVVVLGAFAAVGLGAGWLWQQLWTPTPGAVVDGQWYGGVAIEGDTASFNFESLQRDFSAIGIYVVIGFVAALVLGVLASFLGRRRELVLLLAVTAGSVLAAFLAYRLGVHLGPPDPQVAAAAADDGTRLPGELTLPGTSPFLAWPVGALAGLGLTYLLTSGASEARRRDDEQDPSWLAPTS